jgi:hypothetical protein
MKSQDIFILLKLVSLQQQGQFVEIDAANESDVDIFPVSDPYSARGLAAALGISKSEVNASINRSIAVGMAIQDRVTNHPKANRKAVLEFIIYGLKYVFPAKPAGIARGIPTSFSAPVLKGELLSAGEFVYVWPDARGKEKGQSVMPLFKSVPVAVKKDPRLYEYLALVDAIRLGNPRELKIAIKILKERFQAE